MKSYNRKKIITISVLVVAVVLLAGGLWVYMDSMGNNEPAIIVDDDTAQEPDAPQVPDIKIPVINGQNTQAGDTGGSGSGAADTGQTKTSDDKPKTPAEAKEPPKPEHVTPDEHEITGTENPNVPPSSMPTPAQPEPDSPKSGDKQDGKIYVPGFGWIEDNGGGVEVEEAPNAGTGEKVGDM